MLFIFSLFNRGSGFYSIDFPVDLFNVTNKKGNVTRPLNLIRAQTVIITVNVTLTVTSPLNLIRTKTENNGKCNCNGNTPFKPNKD